MKALKSIAVVGGTLLFMALGARRCAYESISAVGPIGMDDLGRQALCEKMDREAQHSSTQIRVRCGGFNSQVMIMEFADRESLVGTFDEAAVLEQMKRPFMDSLNPLDGLVLRGDKLRKEMNTPVPIREIADRLDELGAITVADFYAACGFSRLVFRVASTGDRILEVDFGGPLGTNPVTIK